MELKRNLLYPVVFFIAALIWLFAFHRGLTTAYDVWIVSEIYNHCLLVLPVVAFLIWEKRTPLQQTHINPNYWLILPIVGLLLLQLFSDVGDIKILMHMATFFALPLIIWCLIGNAAARVIAFPLFFVLFSIPIGDQLIPYLQEITTDISVPLLELTGVPIYRNGLYLDIPAGRFLVAEACSGISFLITTISFGFLYSYMFLTQRKTQIIFVLIALALPILANALRVYGIILVAHLTDMEHAVGTDHLIYGGVFYAIILFLLALVGEVIRSREAKQSTDKTQTAETIGSQQESLKSILPTKAIGILLVLFTVQQVWVYKATHIAAKASIDATSGITVDGDWHLIELPLTSWKPSLDDKLTIAAGQFQSSERAIYFYAAQSIDPQSKLIRSSNRLYDQQQWSLLSNTTSVFNGLAADTYKITSPSGEKLTLLKWYVIGSKHFSSDAKARLYQAWLKLQLTSVNSSIFILALPQGMEREELSYEDLGSMQRLMLEALKHDA